MIIHLQPDEVNHDFVYEGNSIEYKTAGKIAVVIEYSLEYSDDEDEPKDYEKYIKQEVKKHSGLSKVIILDDANIWGR